MNSDKEKISKLPIWAQQHIKDLQRERDVVVRALKEFKDTQTASHFYVEDHICDGEKTGPSVHRHYVQTKRIKIAHQGHEFEVSIESNGLDVRTNTGRLVVLPYVSNSIRVHATRL